MFKQLVYLELVLKNNIAIKYCALLWFEYELNLIL